MWVQPCPLPGWWLYQSQIKWCNNQVCHTSCRGTMMIWRRFICLRSNLWCTQNGKSTDHQNQPNNQTSPFPICIQRRQDQNFFCIIPATLAQSGSLWELSHPVTKALFLGRPCGWRPRSLGAQQQTQRLDFVLPWTVPRFLWHRYSTNGTKHIRHYFRIDCKKLISLCQVKNKLHMYSGFCFFYEIMNENLPYVTNHLCILSDARNSGSLRKAKERLFSTVRYRTLFCLNKNKLISLV